MTALQARRPKLVFFQWDHSPIAHAKYIQSHTREHVRCLAHYFDVTVVNQDCDYRQVCDRYEPDLALFESGYQSATSRRIDIRNTDTNPNVLKAALFNADAWAHTRSGLFSDLDRWGIKTVFSICTTSPQYMPADGLELFVWPNFIDPYVFRDYGIDKSVPIMLTGQRSGLYPWRNSVFPLLSEAYACLSCPPFWYTSGLASRALSGVPYARALNASFFAPTCGTMAREVVRKHLEIPGSTACLVTENSPGLEAAGFVHMENCVFADRSDVIEILDHLFAHPDELERITIAGHDLVHARHTLLHRPQIYQWFTLKQHLLPSMKIVQASPFGDLAAVSQYEVPQPALARVGADRILIRNAGAMLLSGQTEDAAAQFAAALEYDSVCPEAAFGLALCDLAAGEAESAATRLGDLIKTTVADYGASDPDPVEWAYFIIAQICRGRLDEARGLIDWYPRLSHRELDYVRRAIYLLSEELNIEESQDRPNKSPRLTVHKMPQRSFAEWQHWLWRMLVACRQPELAARLDPFEPTAEHYRRPVRQIRRAWSIFLYRGLDTGLRILRLGRIKPNVPPLPELRYVDHVLLLTKRLIVGSRVARPTRRIWSRLRARNAVRQLQSRLRGSPPSARS